jgi:hypothetical protein
MKNVLFCFIFLTSNALELTFQKIKKQTKNFIICFEDNSTFLFRFLFNFENEERI